MRRLLALSIFACAFVTLAMANPYRVRLTVFDAAAAKRIVDSSLMLFSENVGMPETDVIVEPRDWPSLWALRVPYRVVSKLPAPDSWRDEGYSDSDEYQTQYLRYENIIAKFDTWRDANPDLVSKFHIGNTVNNRPIYAYRIYLNHRLDVAVPSANALFFCGIHAREWISPAVGMYVMDKLIQDLRNPNSQMFQELADKCAVSIIPSLNPDGYVYTWDNYRMWRKNRRYNGMQNGNPIYGVDLNRNWPTGWNTGGGSSGNINSDTYRGPSSGSELETQAGRNYALSLNNLRAFIDFHSYGQYILWPWAYTSATPPGAAMLSTHANAMESAIEGVFGTPFTEGQAYQTLYEADGTTKDWFYSQFNAAAYTIELRDAGDYGFILPEDQIYPTQQEAYAAVKALLASVIN